MWYFTWILGIGFAVMFSIVIAIWGEHQGQGLEDESKINW